MSGSATTAGTTFQENIAAWFACIILADEKAVSVAGLPSDVTLDGLNAESIQPVDDIQITTSAGGYLFAQAKTTLSFSENDEQFVSTIRQFVEQFQNGYVSASGSRELNELNDRLILAVSAQCPATIRNDLRALLDTVRPCHSVQLFENARAGLSDLQRQRLDMLGRIIANQCVDLGIAQFDTAQFQRLLRLIHVLPLDFGDNGHSAREANALLRQVILCDPSRSDEAWNLLIAIVRDFSPRRTGGDRRFFREVFERHGLIPRPVASGANDRATLAKRSASFERHVDTFSVIPFQGNEIRIERPIVKELLAEASSGDILITGSAGAGKSGCLAEFVREARRQDADVLLLAVDQLAANTLNEISEELRLEPNRDIVDVLADWSGTKRAYLIIDALDAARTTYGLTSLCNLIQQIRRHATRWKVITSIREFDLRYSQDVRRLFRGKPISTQNRSEFEDVHHLYVSPLTDGELADFSRQAPDVAEVRSKTSPEFQELTRNPFNLRLLAELVENAVELSRVTQIKTQVGLLDLYWDERISRLDQDGTLQSFLSECVRGMVDRRTLKVKESELQSGSPPKASLDRLASGGLLHVEEGALPGTDRQISFVHNILFDYAVARLMLKNLPEDIVNWLGIKESQDLLLAIRPSVVLTFQRLWYSDNERRVFWDRALAFTANKGIRLFGKIIAADVAALEFRTTEDMFSLMEQLNSSAGQEAKTLLQFTLQAALAHFAQDSVRFPLVGTNAPQWLKLSAELAEHYPDAASWQVRNVLAQIGR